MLPFAKRLSTILYIVIVLMFLLSLITNQYRLFDVIWLIICLSAIIATGGNLFLYLVLIAFSMRNSDLSLLLKYTAVAIAFSLLFIFLTTKLGITPNLMFVRNGVLRSSLGMRFPLLFGAYVFSLSAILTILYGKNYPIRLTLFLVLAAFFIGNVTNARNDAFSILLLIIVLIMQRIPSSILQKTCVTLANLIFIISFFIPFVTYIFPYGSFAYNLLDKLTTGRLYYQNILCSFYKPHLLGQYITEVGLGGSTGNVNNYFYIDSSLTRLMYIGGIVFFIAFLYSWRRCAVSLAKNKLFIFSLVFLVVWVNGFVEDSMADSTTCIFGAFLLIQNYVTIKDNASKV